RDQIMFTFSHNHCGPRLGDDLVDYYPVEAEQVRLVEEYTARMVEKTVALVGEAIAALAPASLRIGEGEATFAVNRRNNAEAKVPDLLARGKSSRPSRIRRRATSWREPCPQVARRRARL